MFKVSTAVFFEWGWETTCVLGDSDFCLEDIGLDQLAISIRDANYNRVLLLPFCACALYLKACRSAGLHFIPLVAETLGGLADDTIQTVRSIGKAIADRVGYYRFLQLFQAPLWSTSHRPVAWQRLFMATSPPNSPPPL